MASRTARWWPGVLPVAQLVSGVTPLPAVAWVRRMLSPAVRTTWAWCRRFPPLTGQVVKAGWLPAV